MSESRLTPFGLVVRIGVLLVMYLFLSILFFTMEPTTSKPRLELFIALTIFMLCVVLLTVRWYLTSISPLEGLVKLLTGKNPAITLVKVIVYISGITVVSLITIKAVIGISLDPLWISAFAVVVTAITSVILAGATICYVSQLQQQTKIMVKPSLIAYLREKEKGLGIYIENIGRWIACNGTVICSTSIEKKEYTFVRLPPGWRYEFPPEGEALQISSSDTKLSVVMKYYDIDGEEHTQERRVPL